MSDFVFVVERVCADASVLSQILETVTARIRHRIDLGKLDFENVRCMAMDLAMCSDALRKYSCELGWDHGWDFAWDKEEEVCLD